MKRVFAPAGEFEPRSRREGLHLWYQIDFDEDYPASLAKSFLEAYPGITLVECDPIRRLYGDVTYSELAPGASDGPFDDPLFYRQWHYYNDGSHEGAEAGCDINVVPAWSSGYIGNPEVIVCVVDGGVITPTRILQAISGTTARATAATISTPTHTILPRMRTPCTLPEQSPPSTTTAPA
ncbi:MAG: hypothetical protein IKH11_04100 [Bacteroidales bacterium]|nr:hypothetical protein [Bacteroidales bacterium]